MGTNEEQEFLRGVRKSVERGGNYQPHAGEEAERPTTHRWMDPGWNEETSMMFSVLHYIVSTVCLGFFFLNQAEHCQPFYGLTC